jgi:hypothetical protein
MTGHFDGHIRLQARADLGAGTTRTSCFRLVRHGRGFSTLWAW